MDGGEDTRTSRRKRQLTSRVNAREERKTRVNDLSLQIVNTSFQMLF